MYLYNPTMNNLVCISTYYLTLYWEIHSFWEEGRKKILIKRYFNVKFFRELFKIRFWVLHYINTTTII